jgi:hypothetical protein
MMKRKGYLWNYHGFTNLHLWGVLPPHPIKPFIQPRFEFRKLH